MRFQVPQHIDVEDKIFLNLTWKQLLYLIGNTGLAYVVYSLSPVSIVGIPLAILFLAFGFMLAFYEYNNRPFVKLVESIFYFYYRPRLYVWKPRPKEERKIRQVDMSKYRSTRKVSAPAQAVGMTTSRLDDASWQINM